MTGIEDTLAVSEKRGQFTTEKAFEKRFCKLANDRWGLRTLKLTGYTGIPDRFIFPNHFIEFKTNFFKSDRIPVHKNWTAAQRQWARDIHDWGGCAWYACLLQDIETKKKYFYFEPSVWSLWAHDKSMYSLKEYQKNSLVSPSQGEKFADHMWERLETNYYERTFAPFREGDEKTPTSDAVNKVQRHSRRLVA